MRKFLAKLLYPEVFERYQLLLDHLHVVKQRCAYEFPTVGVTVDFVLNESSTPTVEDVRAWLEREYCGSEPQELSAHLSAALEGEDSSGQG